MVSGLVKEDLHDEGVWLGVSKVLGLIDCAKTVSITCEYERVSYSSQGI